jgi:hypothetical protein
MNGATHPDPVGPLLASVRRRLRLRHAVRAMATAVVAVGITAVALLLADVVLGLPDTARSVVRWLPVIALLTPVVVFLRAWASIDPTRLSLLVDETSGLGNVVSTLANPNADGVVADAFRRRASHAADSLDSARVVPIRFETMFAAALIVLVLGGAAMSSSTTRDALNNRWWHASAGGSDEAGVGATAVEETDAPPTLGSIEVLVRPPAYSDLPETRADAEAAVFALPGSRVEIVGSGTARAPGLSATVVGGGALTPAVSESGWSLAWIVGPEDRGLALTLTERDEVIEQRVIPLRLLRDRPPTVELTAPTEDLVLARSTGRIPIEVTARDDYAVEELTLHWVLSRGSGESFDFDEGVWAWDSEQVTTEGREARLALSLDDLALGAGDMLHVRATATDANTVTGPGLGVSATRQIRISRDDDLADVTTLIGFPIEREREPLLSQRMIILLTEELRDSAATTDAESFRDAAIDIADEQARLRARIGEQIFSRATGAMQDPEAHLDFEEGEPEVFLDELENLVEQGPVIDPVTGIASVANVDIPAHEHDSDPIVAINRSLLTVYNYMWDAERELRATRLDPSLVPQYLALDELQRLRESERVFARGRVAAPPIDIAGTRGTGELDDASPALRSPIAPRVASESEVVARIEALLVSSAEPIGRANAIMVSGLAIDVLELGVEPSASDYLVEAARRAEEGDAGATRDALRRAARALRGSATRTSPVTSQAPRGFAGARYALDSEPPTRAASNSGEAGTRPFVFATVRYQSGDWDSAPLVPTNLIHSLAQYTDLPVEPEGVVVDLASDDVFEHSFLYLTGHLPVFFDEAESRNLVDFVDRGGFVFIDDHNHDIDGAFHRSVTSEIERLFGAERFSALPNDHELYSSFFEFDDGPPITGHELSGWGDGLIHRQLFAVEAAGRIGVLYSNKDYSSEWSYHAENKRFLAVDNTRFGVNILMYALTR